MANLYRKIQDLFKSSATSQRAAKRRDIPWRWDEQSDGSYAPVVAAILTGNIGGEDQLLLVDDMSGALVTIDEIHHEVHTGNTFRVWNLANIASGADIDIVLAVGATLAPHVAVAANFSADMDFFIYRSPTITGGTGSNMTIQNLNDNSLTVSTLSALLNPTVTNVGTEIDAEFLPGGSSGAAVGGAIRSSTENIFRLNTTYLIRVTNNTAQPQRGSLEVEWYEEEI